MSDPGPADGADDRLGGPHPFAGRAKHLSPPPPAAAASYDARLISKYIFDARLATLVRCAAFETSRATAGDTFRLKTDGKMYSTVFSSFATQVVTTVVIFPSIPSK